MVLVLAAAAVFALYMPNRPDRVFKSSLDRSGIALNRLVDSATNADKLNALKKSQATAKVDATYASDTFKGTFTAKFDPSHSDSGVDITMQQNGKSKTFSGKLLTELPAKASYPNIYFQIKGLNQLGLGALAPYINPYDGKWIAIEGDYLKSLGLPLQARPSSQPKQLTAADATELTKAVGRVTGKYILTSSPQTAVLQQRSFIGKEVVDGLKTYRYEVAVNKVHLKDYCQALITGIIDTSAYKKLQSATANAETTKQNLTKACHNSIDNNKDLDKTFDLWMNAKDKVIYKLRLTDSSHKGAYTDIGQRTTSTKHIEVFVNNHDPVIKEDDSIVITSNLDTATTNGTMSFSGGETGHAYKVKIGLEIKPYSGTISTSKPKGAIPIADVLKQFGIDPSFIKQFYQGYQAGLSGGAASSAKDTERQTDIKALHGQLEAYYAQNGRYPTLANVNSSSWRQQNMLGLDNEALKDPDGSSYNLVAAPQPNNYAYVVKAANGTACDNVSKDCTAYTLTAVLSDGSSFTKQSLN